MRPILFFFIVLSLNSCQEKNEYTPLLNFVDGLKRAKEMNRPVFLYFTCWGCIGYDRFGLEIIKDSRVLNNLSQNFVSIELYTDDQKRINDTILRQSFSQIKFSTSSKEKILKFKTIGILNSEIEATLFEKKTQPLYVLLKPNGETIVPPFGYFGKDIEFFLKKLEEAKASMIL